MTGNVSNDAFLWPTTRPERHIGERQVINNAVSFNGRGESKEGTARMLA